MQRQAKPLRSSTCRFESSASYEFSILFVDVAALRLTMPPPFACRALGRSSHSVPRCGTTEHLQTALRLRTTGSARIIHAKAETSRGLPAGPLVAHRRAHREVDPATGVPVDEWWSVINELWPLCVLGRATSGTQQAGNMTT
ncbi:hypothetical protein KM043_018319 [Ampulex compressa]|nr:hypothetical protein KM043_018319 [Ampulex compressa]